MPAKTSLSDEELLDYSRVGLSVAQIAALYRITEAAVRSRLAALERARLFRERVARAALSGRPKPPDEIADLGAPAGMFVPAPDLADWAAKTFIGEGGVLHNPDHAHLAQACLGLLWTNAPCRRHGRPVAGLAEIPGAQGNGWLRARVEWQLTRWFGQVPEFLITLDAGFGAVCEDAAFCALVEHEMYHCGQALDEFGTPKFTKDGLPSFALRGHDVEEFVAVVRRYGAGAAAEGVTALADAAARPPSVAPAGVAAACGNCLRA